MWQEELLEWKLVGGDRLLKRRSSAGNWLQYGGERIINRRPRYIGACFR